MIICDKDKCHHLRAEKRYHLGMEDDWYCPDCGARPSRYEVERLRKEHEAGRAQPELDQEGTDEP